MAAGWRGHHQQGHPSSQSSPLDAKEGRFSLGQLKCSGETRFETETGVIRLQRVMNNQKDNHGHLSEVFFEFLTEEERSVELFYERLDRDNYCKVVLVSDRTIVYEWSSGGMMENIAVEIENRLNDGRWHTVNIERNIMEVMVLVDRHHMTNVRMKKQKIENDPSYTVSNLEVWRCLSIWRDPYHIFAGPCS